MDRRESRMDRFFTQIESKARSGETEIQFEIYKSELEKFQKNGFKVTEISRRKKTGRTVCPTMIKAIISWENAFPQGYMPNASQNAFICGKTTELKNGESIAQRFWLLTQSAKPHK